MDLARLDLDDRRFTGLELDLVKTAQAHETPTCSRLRAMPGGGKVLALELRDELPDIHRFPRGPAVVSSGRLVTCATASAGQRSGTGGPKIGHADRTGACSEAAGLFLRPHPLGQTARAPLARKPGTAQALASLAPQRGRAVSGLRQRPEAFARPQFLAT